MFRLVKFILVVILVAVIMAGCAKAFPSATAWNRPICSWENGGSAEIEIAKKEDFCRLGTGWLLKMNGSFR